MTNRIRLGELLVRAGVLDELKLKAALAEQQRWGGRLGKILVDMRFVSEEILVKALSKQLGIPRADFSRFNVPVDVLAQIPRDFAESHALCPVHFDARRRVLTVATSDPTNVQAIDELWFKTGLRIETALVGFTELQRQIDQRLAGGHGRRVDTNEALELDDSGVPLADTEAFQAAMAASGQVVELEDDGGLDSTAPAPEPAPAPGAAPDASSPLQVALGLDGAQRQQHKAVRVMLELLVEKGLFSREEYLRLLNER